MPVGKDDAYDAWLISPMPSPILGPNPDQIRAFDIVKPMRRRPEGLSHAPDKASRCVGQRDIPGEGMCYVYEDGTVCRAIIDGEPVNPSWGITKAGKPRKRLAQACLTCQEKKIKCEPGYPTCLQCAKSQRVCRGSLNQLSISNALEEKSLSSSATLKTQSAELVSPVAGPNKPRALNKHCEPSQKPITWNTSSSSNARNFRPNSMATSRDKPLYSAESDWGNSMNNPESDDLRRGSHQDQLGIQWEQDSYEIDARLTMSSTSIEILPAAFLAQNPALTSIDNDKLDTSLPMWPEGMVQSGSGYELDPLVYDAKVVKKKKPYLPPSIKRRPQRDLQHDIPPRDESEAAKQLPTLVTPVTQPIEAHLGPQSSFNPNSFRQYSTLRGHSDSSSVGPPSSTAKIVTEDVGECADGSYVVNLTKLRSIDFLFPTHTTSSLPTLLSSEDKLYQVEDLSRGRKRPAGTDLDARRGLPIGDTYRTLASSQTISVGYTESLDTPYSARFKGRNEVDARAAPSDSGYQSGLGADTESMCSMDSVGSSLGFPQDFLQDFIAFFGDMLIEKASARQWAASCCEWSEEIEKKLNALLKEYAVKLSSKPLGYWASVSSQALQQIQDPAQIQMLRGAINLVWRHRSKIVRYFRINAVSLPMSDTTLSLRLQGLGKQLSLDESVGLLAKSSIHMKDLTEAEIDVQEEDNEMQDDGNQGDLFANFEPVREFLVSSEAFHRLTRDLRRTLYNNDGQELKRIRELVLDDSRPPLYYAHFDVHWDLRHFMSSQYGDKIPTVGSALVLTGSTLFALATTCDEYVQKTWPRAGPFIIKLLDDAIGTSTTPISIAMLKLNWHYLNINMKFARSETLTVSIETDDQGLIIEAAQQIAWMGSALSGSPFGSQMAYARPSIQKTSTPFCYDFTFEHKPIHVTETACWLPLFCGATIASGFPIPDREEEMGLEISLEALAGIAGIRHAVEYKGGLVMKGFSHMFVPVRKTEDRVQWHAVSSRDPDTRLTYNDGLARCKSRALLEDVSFVDLQSCRAIVGWCSVATSRLGSESANYDNIDYSGAREAEPAIRCAGGSLGFQQFGMAALDFKFGLKEGKCHFQRNGPYQRIISAAEKTPIVLYDTGEQRAWLVPASEVMLHIVQHRHCLEPFEVNGNRIKIETNVLADPSARNILLKSASLQLSDDNYTFKDNILSIWSLLEFLVDENVSRDRTTPGASVKNPIRDYLHGFEFKAVVEERSPFRQKQTPLERTNGGWPQLVRDIDALVLLADGFEDIIVPADQGNERLCQPWQRVPKGKDHLATSTKMIKELYDVAGCRLNRRYLTSSQLQWHQGDSKLFSDCEESGTCHCDRLQQICSKSSLVKIQPPKHIVDQGAVIFGRSGTIIQELISINRAQTPKVSGIYSQPNVSLMPIVIRHDTEDIAFSDGEISGRNSTDASIESIPGSLSSCAMLSTQDGLSEIIDVDMKDGSLGKSRKRSHSPGIHLGLPDQDAQGTVFERKRVKSTDAFDSHSELPIECYHGIWNDDRGQRHGRLDSALQGTDWTSKAGTVLSNGFRDEALFSISVDQTEDTIEVERRPDLVPLVVRLADDQAPRTLRRQEGFTLGKLAQKLNLVADIT